MLATALGLLNVSDRTSFSTIIAGLILLMLGVATAFARDKDGKERLVEDIARKYLDRGVDTILLACTEPAVMLKDVDLRKIDTLDVLVQATFDFCLRTELNRRA